MTFGKKALLDVGFSGNARSGAWDVMRWDGDVVDHGLMFAPNMDADAWYFTYIDTDHSGGADTLRVTHSASE